MAPTKPACCNPLNTKHSYKKKQVGLQQISDEFVAEGRLAFPNFNWQKDLFLCLSCRVKLDKEFKKHKVLRFGRAVIQKQRISQAERSKSGPSSENSSTSLPVDKTVPSDDNAADPNAPEDDAETLGLGDVAADDPNSSRLSPEDLPSYVQLYPALPSDSNTEQNPSTSGAMAGVKRKGIFQDYHLEVFNARFSNFLTIF